MIAGYKNRVMFRVTERRGAARRGAARRIVQAISGFDVVYCCDVLSDIKAMFLVI